MNETNIPQSADRAWLTCQIEVSSLSLMTTPKCLGDVARWATPCFRLRRLLKTTPILKRRFASFSTSTSAMGQGSSWGTVSKRLGIQCLSSTPLGTIPLPFARLRFSPGASPISPSHSRRSRSLSRSRKHPQGVHKLRCNSLTDGVFNVCGTFATWPDVRLSPLSGQEPTSTNRRALPLTCG